MIGERFGLVTIYAMESKGNRVMYFGVCTCGARKWYKLSNLKKHPPKTHRTCHRDLQHEMKFYEEKARHERRIRVFRTP